MADWVASVSKAIAALVVPFVMYGIAELAEWVGMDPPDTDIVDTAVIAIVSAVVVWWVRNRPAPVTVDTPAPLASSSSGAGTP